MNNRLKFRAWNKEIKRLIEWEEINELRNLQKLMSLNFIDLMQWTGLTDKNGKEIYEGDILTCNYVVTYNAIFASYLLNYDNNKGFRLSRYFEEIPRDQLERMEVIGNIYENPNLLENE